jgi:hypothetical protein
MLSFTMKNSITVLLSDYVRESILYLVASVFMLQVRAFGLVLFQCKNKLMVISLVYLIK